MSGGPAPRLSSYACCLQVAQHAGAIERVLEAITALDLATARARHAAWLGAVRPSFLSAEDATAQGLVRIPRAWHPLLLQPCLPPLPAPPVVDLPPRAGSSSSFADSEDEQGGEAGLGLVPELAGEKTDPLGAAAQAGRSSRARAGPRGGDGATGSSSSPGSEAAAAAHPLPVPTQLAVPPGVRVAAVTGPNTGGKTASLKALGLLSLMAKAGCFIPQAPPSAAGAEGAAGETMGGAAGAGSSDAPRLVWFDKVRGLKWCLEVLFGSAAQLGSFPCRPRLGRVAASCTSCWDRYCPFWQTFSPGASAYGAAAGWDLAKKGSPR